MNYRERENRTMTFSNEGLDRGALHESMYPWEKTVAAWRDQGLDTGFLDEIHFATLPTENLYSYNAPYEEYLNYYNTMFADAVNRFETAVGHDPIKRVCFRIPFFSFKEEVLIDNGEYTEKRDRDGWIRRYFKDGRPRRDITPVVHDWESWEALRAHTRQKLDEHCTAENVERAFGPFRDGDEEFALRFRINGFFWLPRDLMGIEEHLIGYHDVPDLIKEINSFQLDVYLEQLAMIFDVIQPSSLFFEEDISGRNGPMISPATFEEFIVPRYREIVPFLKERGVGDILLDTDGDFTALIPHFDACGLDGVLPVDFNAGVDIVEVREAYPTLKFWGGFNKLALVDGRDAIDTELSRLEPVIRQGGCIICTDHQPAPHTPLDNYLYFTRRLHEVMSEWRGKRALH